MRPPATQPLHFREVIATWWPLAASWALMGLEMPAISAVVARLEEPKIHLAAYGGMVFPIALLIEAPIIMMLAASTALCRDEAGFRRLKRFMVQSAVILTALHAAIAFTPLYDLIARGIIGVPEEVVEPGRLGLRLMTPWTWAIADRRFNQGILIRFGRSRAVGQGTAIRLAAMLGALLITAALGWPGIAVASAALSFGVLVEAVYARLAVAPIIAGPLRDAPDSGGGSLTFRRLLVFYIPLALTPMLGLATQPMGSAAMSHMPDPLMSLAAWPALSGIVFLMRSFGIAFNEVVVSLSERRDSTRVLRLFALILGSVTTLALAVPAFTPLGRWWFAGVCGLDPELTELASSALWLGVLAPALTVGQSFYSGLLVHARRTAGIPESMALFLLAAGGVLGAGIVWAGPPGVHVMLVAMIAGASAQNAWLAVRCRPVLRTT